MPTKDDLIKETDRLLELQCDITDMNGVMQVGSECYQGTMTLLNAVYGPGSSHLGGHLKTRH